ncbi:MAG: hypothetical protein CM1200mP41_39400 [Gammaproteobacteria bacterium]|nr:MAG: hypothetical protein CM1200mP41_39400 [Gammaproteobacteria bacterium]
MTSSVRQARTNDVPSIHRLLDYYAARGQLLPRSLDELTEHISSFTVINEADHLTGCAALEVFTEDLGGNPQPGRAGYRCRGGLWSGTG